MTEGTDWHLGLNQPNCDSMHRILHLNLKYKNLRYSPLIWTRPFECSLNITNLHDLVSG